MDFLLKHQNKEFKKFQNDYKLSLPELDEMFWLYTLLVDVFQKVKLFFNKILFDQYQSGYHSTKDALFDILSLVDQFYWSKLTHLTGLLFEKIYFSKNQIPNLLK